MNIQILFRMDNVIKFRIGYFGDFKLKFRLSVVNFEKLRGAPSLAEPYDSDLSIWQQCDQVD